MSDQLKLSKALAKKAKRAATGPLLGPIEPAAKAPPAPAPATIAPLGTIQSVLARIETATEA